jgi:hypothetical protein
VAVVLCRVGNGFASAAIASHVKSPGPLGHVAQLLLLQAWSPDHPTYAGGNGVTAPAARRPRM